jgi:hypothetical protein
MNGQPLTDDQISRALRAHVPARAASGLRERVLDAAEATAQQRALPSFLGALSEADPVVRRRSLLVAAALLVALAFAGAAAVGALRLLDRDPVRDLSLEPPTDVQAFVLSSYERLPALPPLAMTRIDNGSAKSRMYVDRSGAVRFEQYASADATEPETFRILNGDSVGSLEAVGSEKVWVLQHEAIGEDPRVYIRSSIGLGGVSFDRLPGCELTRNTDEAGNGTEATGWRYVGVETVTGRPAHRFTCDGGDLWLDAETRLILRARAPLIDDADQPIPGKFETIDVTEIAFGEQPAALFDLEAPAGVVTVPIEELEAYRCARDPICSAAPPSERPHPDTGVPGNDPPPGSSPAPGAPTEQTDAGAPGNGPSANP